MPKIRILLVLTFCVLLVLIVWEVFYLFILKPNSNTSTNPSETKQGKTENVNIEESRLAGGGGSSKNESKLKTEGYRGIVQSIDTTSGHLEDENFSYDVKIILRNGEGKEVPVYFTNKELSLARVFNASSPDTPLSFNDVKVGDNLMIQLVIDTSKDSSDNNLETTITVF